MDNIEFWNLIARVKKSGGEDIEERSDALSEELGKLEPDEIISFSNIFSSLLDQAYSWNLWGAAYIMQGGCGDDSFWDFRSSLISIGKEVFERALENPDSLADLDDHEIDNLYFEGFQYVAEQVYEDLTEKELPARSSPHPSEPSGTGWDFDNEDEAMKKLPRLFSKYWGKE